MSSSIPWETVLRMARAAAMFAPPPWNVVSEIAISIAAGLVADGCEIENCPVEIKAELARSPIPTGEAGLQARVRAKARARGLGV